MNKIIKKYGLITNTMEDIYELLKKQYKVKWIDEHKNAFNLEFSLDKKLYKIYVDKNYIGLSKQKKFLSFKYWDNITHDHYDNDETNFLDIYEGIIYILKKYNKYQSIEQYLKDNIIKIYEDITKKKCYKMNFNEQVNPGILDSKLFGIPYLPKGEKYPTDKDGTKLSLFIQINLDNIKLDNFPQKGILQVYANAKKVKAFELDSSMFKVKYYEDVTKEYQDNLSEVETFDWFGYSKSVKLELTEHYTLMPIQNHQFDTVLEQLINIYNDNMNANLNCEIDGEIPESIFDVLYDECQKIEPLILGGYSGYSNGTTDGGEACEIRGKDNLIKIVDWHTCMNIIISKEDLINKKFENAEVFYMW